MLDRKTVQKLQKLASRHETPFFAFGLQKLKANEACFLKTAREFFPRLKVCYSVKTNPNPSVLKALSTGFELASLEELKLVKQRKAFKVLNGCCKKPEELREALRQNAMIICDSFSELEKIIALRKAQKIKMLEIGVRLNAASKFGIELSKIREFVKKAESAGLKIVLLHAHPGVHNSLKDYEEFARLFLKAARLHDFKFLDFGSGFPSFSKMQKQGQKLEDYFSIVKRELGSLALEKTIVFEPGRVLVADAGFLVCKACALKELKGERIAVLDAGINVLQKIVLEDFEFELLSVGNGAGSFRLAGPLLFGNDWLGTTNSNLQEGDLIAVKNTGAYCFSLAWEVSYGKPKAFLL